MHIEATTKSSLILVATAVLAFLGGGFVGSRLTDRQDTEVIRALELSDAALATTRYVKLLEAMRDGKYDGAIERLETDLDFALIDVAREYTSPRDHYGNAAKSLAMARDYRVAHPRTTALAPVDQQVHAALATKTESPAPAPR